MGVGVGFSFFLFFFFCLWRFVSGAEAVLRWARDCASVALWLDGLALASLAALRSDGLALVRWLRCLPFSTVFLAAGRF